MKKKKAFQIVVGALILAVLVLGIYNTKHNPQFFSASSTQVVTLIVALVVAFWATQFKNDERKQKEHAESIINKLQQIVSDESFVIINEDSNTQDILMRNKKISNCITILKKYADNLSFKSDAEYIENEFKEYRSLVDEKIKDLDYLSKSESMLRKYAENIDSKCDSITFNLYK